MCPCRCRVGGAEVAHHGHCYACGHGASPCPQSHWGRGTWAAGPDWELPALRVPSLGRAVRAARGRARAPAESRQQQRTASAPRGARPARPEQHPSSHPADPQLTGAAQDAESAPEFARGSQGLLAEVDAHVAGTVRALQDDMQRVLQRLSELETLASAQVRVPGHAEGRGCWLVGLWCPPRCRRSLCLLPPSPLPLGSRPRCPAEPCLGPVLPSPSLSGCSGRGCPAPAAPRHLSCLAGRRLWDRTRPAARTAGESEAGTVLHGAGPYVALPRWVWLPSPYPDTAGGGGGDRRGDGPSAGKQEQPWGRVPSVRAAGTMRRQHEETSAGRRPRKGRPGRDGAPTALSDKGRGGVRSHRCHRDLVPPPTRLPSVPRQAASPWPLAVSPRTLLFLLAWPFVTQWLLRRWQGTKR